MNIYSLEFEKESEISFPINNGRQVYLVQVEGCSSINSIKIGKRCYGNGSVVNVYFNRVS
ncbi:MULTISPECIES: hypothetical protein [unclassified Clostridium]|uniref:pirin family protein n=1 Tax=unclassified Clostridium TaxID=2614128 RepID=UPI0037C103DB